MQRRIKRLMDIAVSAIAIVVLSPVMALTALAVRLVLGSPVVFTRNRPGLRGRPFTMYKFRTMMDATDSRGAPLPDEQRLTRFGHFLRSTSLDELPELFNVLVGDMSVVGPRPLLMEYLDRYTPRQARRHEVPPGITGWAQIRGRNAVSWEEKFELDLWYVDHWSIWLDVTILWATVWKVMRREGINSEGHATAPAFMGSVGRDASL